MVQAFTQLKVLLKYKKQMEYYNKYNVDGLVIRGGLVQKDYTLHFIGLTILFLLSTLGN